MTMISSHLSPMGGHRVRPRAETRFGHEWSGYLQQTRERATKYREQLHRVRQPLILALEGLQVSQSQIRGLQVDHLGVTRQLERLEQTYRNNTKQLVQLLSAAYKVYKACQWVGGPHAAISDITINLVAERLSELLEHHVMETAAEKSVVGILPTLLAKMVVGDPNAVKRFLDRHRETGGRDAQIVQAQLNDLDTLYSSRATFVDGLVDDFAQAHQATLARPIFTAGREQLRWLFDNLFERAVDGNRDMVPIRIATGQQSQALGQLLAEKLSPYHQRSYYDLRDAAARRALLKALDNDQIAGHSVVVLDHLEALENFRAEATLLSIGLSSLDNVRRYLRPEYPCLLVLASQRANSPALPAAVPPMILEKLNSLSLS